MPSTKNRYLIIHIFLFFLSLGLFSCNKRSNSQQKNDRVPRDPSQTNMPKQNTSLSLDKNKTTSVSIQKFSNLKMSNITFALSLTSQDNVALYDATLKVFSPHDVELQEFYINEENQIITLYTEYKSLKLKISKQGYQTFNYYLDTSNDPQDILKDLKFILIKKNDTLKNAPTQKDSMEVEPMETAEELRIQHCDHCHNESKPYQNPSSITLKTICKALVDVPEMNDWFAWDNEHKTSDYITDEDLRSIAFSFDPKTPSTALCKDFH